MLEFPHHNKLPPHSYIVLPPLAAQLLPHFTPSGQITAHSYMAISVMGGNSIKVLPLQPIAAHSYMTILVMGGNS